MTPVHLSSVDLIRDATSRLDPTGKFHPRELPGLRAAVEELAHSPFLPDHPAALFGPWGELGEGARAALRRAVARDMKETLDYHPEGYLWTSLIRGGWELDRFFQERSMAPWVRRRVIWSTCRLSGGPLTVRNRIRSRIGRRRWSEASRVGPEEMLAALGRSPRWLLGDFAEGVAIDPRARGYHIDPGRNVVTAYFVGLDFVPTPNGCCCVEANLRPGIAEDRRTVQEGNPVVDGILDAAERQGARHILWLEAQGPPIPPRMVTDLRDGARAVGIRGEVLEDPCMPSRRHLPPGMERPNHWRAHTNAPENTLVVRRNEFPVGSDFVISNKEPFIRSLHTELRKARDTGVFTLPLTRVPHDVPEAAGPGFPNLVYKYPDSFAGKGVFFLKARDTDHAVAMARELDERHGEPPGMFQPFICSRLIENKRIFDVRTEVLVSPLGVWYLGAMRRESSRPVPAELPEGVVPVAGVFASNLNRGGILTAVPPGEVEEVRTASFVVGEAMRRILERTFEFRPGKTSERPQIP